MSDIKRGKAFYYGTTDIYLYQALKTFSIKNMKVAIMGSQEPLYESVCLVYGGFPITIEYQKIISEDTRLKTMTPDEYKDNPILFDAAFSISSFEHDGLGRYGDPLNPNGDLEAMRRMKKMIKKGGRLYLSVPVDCEDRLVFNLHRIYGRLRLPMLLSGWKLLKIYGKNCWQPIFVLENQDVGEINLDPFFSMRDSIPIDKNKI